MTWTKILKQKACSSTKHQQQNIQQKTTESITTHIVHTKWPRKYAKLAEANSGGLVTRRE